MCDLSLDIDPTSLTYGDLVVTGGDLVLTSDAQAGGTQPILQDIITRLRTFSGEWFLDTTLGVPYFQTVLVKAPDMTAVNTAFKDQILSTPGVRTLDQFSARLLPGTRVLAVAFHASTVAGQVSYSGVLANSSQDQGAA